MRRNKKWAIGDGQLVIGNRQWVIGNRQWVITNHLSPITHYLLPITYYLLLITYCLLINACQETTKGCLDVRATNFDVTVTQACEDNCCIYPYLTLQVDHFYDTTKFSLNKKYKIDGVADSIEFLSFQFYLSNFQLITSDNKIATVIDSIQIARANDTIKILSNYALVSKGNGFQYKIGKFDKPSKYAKVKFQVGLDNIANQAIPSKMPSGSPLSTQNDSMYLKAQNTYIFNKIVYKVKSQSVHHRVVRGVAAVQRDRDQDDAQRHPRRRRCPQQRINRHRDQRHADP